MRFGAMQNAERREKLRGKWRRESRGKQREHMIDEQRGWER